MKTVPINIHDAKSLENAMDLALTQADNACYRASADGRDPTIRHTVSKVKFEGLEVAPSYRERTFVYSFTAILEEQ